jgi:dUTP pyrophosphatase
MSYLLKIQVDDELLRQVYSDKISEHNKKIENQHADSGFDLFMPRNLILQHSTTTLCDLELKCAAYKGNRPVGFYLYPRSSISKTEFRLANHVGIIDSGYRGNLKVAIDCLSRKDNINSKENLYNITSGQRLFQVCMADLTPFRVKMVEKLDATSRGSGGHGSTGK